MVAQGQSIGLQSGVLVDETNWVPVSGHLNIERSTMLELCVSLLD